MSIITINIDTDNYSVDEIAKSVKEQMDALVKPKFPKWEELGRVEGWYVDGSSELDYGTDADAVLHKIRPKPINGPHWHHCQGLRPLRVLLASTDTKVVPR